MAVASERRFLSLVEHGALGGRSTEPDWTVLSKVVTLSLQRVRDRGREDDRARFHDYFDRALASDAAFVEAGRAFEAAPEGLRPQRFRQAYRA
ncbi:MAG: hypothetical protein FJX78_09865 [Armatimonadetes bacterium]|nr:hypothetical protein [Armatimonadota bacterium]